jgi:hypothetical protein
LALDALKPEPIGIKRSEHTADYDSKEYNAQTQQCLSSESHVFPLLSQTLFFVGISYFLRAIALARIALKLRSFSMQCKRTYSRQRLFDEPECALGRS